MITEFLRFGIGMIRNSVIVLILALPVVAAENVIQQENRHLGTVDWLLKKRDDIRRGTAENWRREKAVEGYCSHPSIRAGETLNIYVSTDPVSEWTIDFYRLGYYGGSGGRHMLKKGPFQGQRQPDPVDGPKNLIECRWQAGLKLEIPSHWLSGVYLGKLTALVNGAESYVIFIVRDDRKADFLFQCSDITWQSYNRWPAWRSLYDFGSKQWHTEVGNDVGFDRPYGLYYNGLPADIYPVTNGSGEFLLWEFPLAFWMEKEGYDVTYISNIDTHADAKGLLRAKGFLSVGHDEYWTQQMYDNVSRARDLGLNIAFLSGNSISGRIYLNPSTGGRPYRVFGRIEDFQNEEELMGASSYSVGMADFVCEQPDHWVFAGTGMKRGDRIKELIGWEYHGYPLRKDPSLIVLASSGINGKPEAEHQACTIYDGPKSNFVFNAGTCWWSLPLSKPPGFVNPAKKDFSKDDPRVQQITRNLFEQIRSSAGPRL